MAASCGCGATAAPCSPWLCRRDGGVVLLSPAAAADRALRGSLTLLISMVIVS